MLQYFEVRNEFVVELGLPVYLGQWDLGRIEDINELAVDCASAQLLDFGEISLEKVVDPAEQLATRHFDGVVGVYGYLVYHLSNCIIISTETDYRLTTPKGPNTQARTVDGCPLYALRVFTL